MHINWGDVPTWLAVVVAAVGGGIALRQLRQQGNVIKGEIERNKARDDLLDGQLRELHEREKSRQREQAEAVDMIWHDVPDGDGTSNVTVINRSRRPIKLITCWVVADIFDEEKIRATYGLEMYPYTNADGVTGYRRLGQPDEAYPSIWALRATGRVYTQPSDDDLKKAAMVRYTD
jgi:hypothetical protein